MFFEAKISDEKIKIRVSNGFVESIICDHVLFDSDNLEKLKNTIDVVVDENITRLKIKDVVIAEFDELSGVLKEFPITSFSLKNILFTNNIDNVEIKCLDDRYLPKTDLHTHFGGILSGRELIDIGLEKDLEIPDFVIEALTGKRELLRFSDLSGEDIDKLDRLLSIPIDKQSTFIDMEEIYKCRSFIIKNEELFSDMMIKIAEKYQQEGIEYAEISLSNITDPSYLAKVNELVPKIYKDTGVLITFMAALWRHSDEPWNQYELEKLKKCIHNPYIVGLDIMGQETNSILDMRDILIDFGNYVKGVDPEFNLRIHAGENLTRPENIKESLRIGQATGVKIRIGHGIYGVDDDVIEAALETGAVIEFNLNSNLSLSNIEGYANYVHRYSSRGVNCVYGSDGGGIYHGSAYDSMSVIDLSDEEIEGLRKFELSYIDSKKMQIKSKLKRDGALSIPEETSSAEALVKCKIIEEEKKARINELKKDIKKRNIQIFSEESIGDYTRDKNVFLFSGASRSSWPLISEENQANIEKFIESLIDSMDVEKDVILTGGTNYGVEKLVHEYAYKKGIKVIGTLTEDAMIQEIEDKTISGAIMFRGSWYDKHSRLIDLLSGVERKTAIFIAGGDIVSTEIQAFKNWNQENKGDGSIRTRLMMLNEIQGASSVKAQSHPEYGFHSIDDFNSDLGQHYKPNDLNNVLYNIADYLDGFLTVAGGRYDRRGR